MYTLCTSENLIAVINYTTLLILIMSIIKFRPPFLLSSSIIAPDKMCERRRIWGTTNNGKFEIVSLTPDRIKETIQVMNKSFYPHENICKIMHVADYPEVVKELEHLLETVIKDGVSLIAIEKSTGKIAGISLNKIFTQDNHQAYYDGFVPKLHHPVSKLFLRTITNCDGVVDYLKLMDVDCQMEAMYVTTLPEFRGQGLASLLVQCAIKLAACLKNGDNIKIGINGERLPLEPQPKAVSGIFTSQFTQRMAKTLGFIKVAEIPYTKMDFLPAFTVPGWDNPTVTFEYKTL